MATNRSRHISGRIAWLFQRRTSDVERQMRSFRDSQAALARVCSANRVGLPV